MFNTSSKHTDLVPETFPLTDWGSENTKDSLQKVIDFSMVETAKVINWYATKRKFKRKGGQVLRIGAIVAATFAAMIPVLGQIFEKADGKPGIAPGWSTIAAATVALLISLDKFWGFSDSWIRYMLAEQELSAALVAFQFELQISTLTRKTTDTPEQSAAIIITKCNRLLEQVHSTISAETSGWVGDFRKALAQAEPASKALAAKSSFEAGGINLDIANKT